MARPTLFVHRKFLKLARLLRSDALALGHLEFMWHAANESGDPILGDRDDVEAVARWQGESGELVEALLACGLIDQRSDGLFEIHDYWHHCPDYVRKRATREAKRRERGPVNDRSSSGQCSGTDRSVTGRGTEICSTPAPAPAPAPAPKEEAPTEPSASADPEQPKNGHDRELESAIVAAYHEILPNLPRVRDWNDRRKRKLRARIRERVKDGKPADKLDYWIRVFRKVSDSDFLMGRKTDWRCPGLEWLLEPKNFTKLIEGAYDNHGRS